MRLALGFHPEAFEYESLYYVDVRHRWGIEALLGLFVACGIGWLSRRAEPDRDPLDAAGVPA